jgi:hypothetical protein
VSHERSLGVEGRSPFAVGLFNGATPGRTPGDPPDFTWRTRPERRLLLAVLSDAIVVLTRRESAAHRIDRRDVDATARWVLSDDRRWPCSFVNVCEALGLAHQPLRRALLRPREVEGRVPTRRRLLAGKA